MIGEFRSFLFEGILQIGFFVLVPFFLQSRQAPSSQDVEVFARPIKQKNPQHILSILQSCHYFAVYDAVDIAVADEVIKTSICRINSRTEDHWD